MYIPTTRYTQLTLNGILGQPPTYKYASLNNYRHQSLQTKQECTSQYTAQQCTACSNFKKHYIHHESMTQL